MKKLFAYTIIGLLALAPDANAGPILFGIEGAVGGAQPATASIPSDYAARADGTRIWVGMATVNGVNIPRVWEVSPGGVLSYRDLPIPTGATASGAQAISDNGRYVAINADVAGHAQTYALDMQTGVLELRGSPTATVGFDINNSGQLAGRDGVNAVVHQADGTTTTLVNPLLTIADARAISNNGVVVGTIGTLVGGMQATAWDAAGYHDLSFGADSSFIRAINASGTMGGGSRDDLWTLFDLTSMSITTLADSFGEVTGLNDTGWSWGDLYDPTGQIPAFYRAGFDAPLDVNVWLNSQGVLPLDYIRRIVGIVDHGNGFIDIAYEGSVAGILNVRHGYDEPTTPQPVPEPGSGILLVAGLAIAAARRRWKA